MKCFKIELLVEFSGDKINEQMKKFCDKILSLIEITGCGRDMNSFTIFEGNSLFNEEPIVGVVTGVDGSSRNSKTGPMVQLWVLPRDIDPMRAQKLGLDISVCGGCPLRPYLKDHPYKCYVKPVVGGPCAVWGLAMKQTISSIRANNLAKCAVHQNKIGLRLGAYGDPAALPQSILIPLIRKAAFVTGYTHAWKQFSAQWLKRYCMASVETEDQRNQARSAGWRTFRIVDKSSTKEVILDNEIWCRAKNKGITCAQCRLCSGASSKNKKSIVIASH